MIIDYGGGDSITLLSFFRHSYFQVNKICFADGKEIWGYAIESIVEANNAPLSTIGYLDGVDINVGETLQWKIPSNAFVGTSIKNGDKISYQLVMADGSRLPSWLTFDPNTLTLSGKARREDIAYLNFIIIAKDSKGATAEQYFNLNINAVNNAPVAVGALSDVVLNIGQSATWALPNNAFTDDDIRYGDALTYKLKMADGSKIPSWLTFNSSTGQITGSPATVGTLNLIIVATDSLGLSAEHSLNLNVEVNSIMGNDLNNTLRGTVKDETLYGLGGNDSLYGMAGDDVLVGGKGNDRLEGGQGSDTYRFSQGDGIDEIVNYATDGAKSTDRVEFTDVKSTDASFHRQGNHLIISYSADFSDRVQLTNFFSGVNYEMDAVQFTDRTYSANDIKTLMANAPSTTFGKEVAERLNGTTAHDILYGLGGNDQLYGLNGNDTLIGGQGNDRLEGGRGNDIYRFSQGDGSDEIVNYATDGATAVDRVEFTDVKATDATFTKQGNHLLITYSADGLDRVQLTNFFSGVNYEMDVVQFTDRSYSANELKQAVSGRMARSMSLMEANQLMEYAQAPTPTVNQELHALISAMASFDSGNSDKDFMTTDSSSLTQPLLTSSSY